MTDKIAEIRARHEEGIRAGADADRAYLLAEVERLIRERDWARADVDQLRGDREKMLLDERDFVRKHRAEIERLTRERDEARAEVERLRAENERLYNEDTKTRHALRGWVWVCPDGGDEPTHERVSAVVAEVERLTRQRDEARAEVVRLRAENEALESGLKVAYLMLGNKP